MALADFWTPDQVKTAIGGLWLHRPVAQDDEAIVVMPTLMGLSIDSRSISNGQIFLALKGLTFDGHNFIADAVNNGATMCIVEENTNSDNFRNLKTSDSLYILQVPDTRQALKRLATAYRKTLKTTKIIAVTGSNGKTTTKRIIHSILQTTLRGTVSPASYNNDIGVPLTVLAAKSSDQYLIAEVGTNAPGEIATLAAILQPDIAVITHIGNSHLEGLGSIDNVAAEKATIFRHLNHSGWAIYNCDCDLLQANIPIISHLFCFGNKKDADLRLSETEPSINGTRFTLNDRSQWTIPLLGAHNAMNATAAIAVARRLGLSDDAIQTGLGTVTSPPMRLEVVNINSIYFLNDSYNANPDSTAAALQVFQDWTNNHTARNGTIKRRIIILGSMLELGSESESLHIATAKQALSQQSLSNIKTILILIGEEYRPAAKYLHAAHGDNACQYFDNTDSQTLHNITELLKPHDAVLLKGSRSMQLERIISILQTQCSIIPNI